MPLYLPILDGYVSVEVTASVRTRQTEGREETHLKAPSQKTTFRSGEIRNHWDDIQSMKDIGMQTQLKPSQPLMQF